METARIAGIMAAKRTAELIPLCHSIPLDVVDVEDRFDAMQDCHGSTVATRGRPGPGNGVPGARRQLPREPSARTSSA